MRLDKKKLVSETRKAMALVTGHIKLDETQQQDVPLLCDIDRKTIRVRFPTPLLGRRRALPNCCHSSGEHGRTAARVPFRGGAIEHCPRFTKVLYF